MAPISGWLIDLYPDETGLLLWLLSDDGARLSLRMAFPVSFYAAGDFSLLRQAWRFLQAKDLKLAPHLELRLQRVEKRIQLLEAETKGQLDLSEFYARPRPFDDPADDIRPSP